MISIKVSDEIKNTCSDFRGVAIQATVKNSTYNEELWTQINELIADYKSTHSIEDIKKNKAINATRSAYKKFGKDPNRYRPSSEALCRRILRGLPLYQIDTLVDIINLVSIKTGFSIGGFDADKIDGNSLILGVGEKEEPYEAIGRGFLNIEGLPVYRDSIGGIGTPTSDNERTKIDKDTTLLLTIINSYHGEKELKSAADLLESLLIEYAEADSVSIIYFE